MSSQPMTSSVHLITSRLRCTPPQTSPTPKPYLIHTTDLKDTDYRVKAHNLDPTAVRKTISLGDLSGLTKLGVHLTTIPPRSKSCVMHWHSQDDEWIYVLDSGPSGAVLVTLPPGEKEVKEETIRKGDFLAFPAASGLAHTIVTGDEEVVYLCSGTREPVDVCTYPLIGKKLLVDRTGGEMWYAKEDSIEGYGAGPLPGLRK
ncbi:hypothetical protein BC835DRAFT_258286 [Cytidiella melzeri]|nr:hypothetical protein BC835DRAFT_258286 [Cytidiella melzeri]